jgi:hypothetical protein
VRQWLRSHLTYAKGSRPIRRRSAIVLAVAVAFGVGLIAFPGSAAAQVPNCTPKASTGNDSCVKLNVTPSNAPDTFTGGQRLFLRAKTVYTIAGDCSVGGCLARLTLDFDNDFRLNPGTIPTCSPTKAYGSGQNIAAVWDDCGPDAGASGNAYLSTQVAPTGFGCAANPCVSGQGDARVDSPFGRINVHVCVLVFNGPKDANNNPTLTFYARGPITASTCATNPASNTAGSRTVILKGTIIPSPLAGYGKRLNVVPVIPATPAAFLDAYVYLKRGNYFQARCPSGTSPWKLRGLFNYSGSGEADDVIAPPYLGTTQACS